ncbi:MAG: hypothetical protein ABEN55_19345, partial [Bradymonadaceae bacterium]
MSESDADLARVAGEQLLDTPPDERDSFFEETERLRRRSDAQAGLVYAPLLADPGYRDIWPLLADGILADNHPGDAWLLEQCARRIDDPDAADALRKAAMTLRTRTAGEDCAEEVDGYGLLGGCDGEGAYPICLVLDRDDQTTFLNAVLRTHPPTLRDGFAIPDITRR